MPRDIEISQSLEGSLPHIAEVGEACGILESELEPYGRSKAKVRPTQFPTDSLETAVLGLIRRLAEFG